MKKTGITLLFILTLFPLIAGDTQEVKTSLNFSVGNATQEKIAGFVLNKSDSLGSGNIELKSSTFPGSTLFLYKNITEGETDFKMGSHVVSYSSQEKLQIQKNYVETPIDITEASRGSVSGISEASVSSFELFKSRSTHYNHSSKNVEIEVLAIINTAKNPAGFTGIMETLELNTETVYSFKVILPPGNYFSVERNEYSDVVFQNMLINEKNKKRYVRDQFVDTKGYKLAEEKFPLFETAGEKFYIYENVEGQEQPNKVLLEEKENLFDAVYLDSDKYFSSSAVRHYLNLNYNLGKPLYHYYINSYMLKRKKGFDYKQYRVITEKEGEELKDAALRYLTWGVEYTGENNIYKYSPEVHKKLNEGEILFPTQAIIRNENLSYWVEGRYLEPVNEFTVTGQHRNENTPLAVSGKMKSDYHFQPEADVNYSGLTVTTPFSYNNKPILGYPIPYVKGGIDSPRTFAAKMFSQKKIIDKYRIDNPYKPKSGEKHNPDEYVYSSSDILHAINKINKSYTFKGFYFQEIEDIVKENEGLYPFRPGTGQGMNSSGVDSTGLLSGAISMTSLKKDILNLQNEAVVEELKHYYYKQPEYNFDSNVSTDIYRMTRKDIEKCTVIVPNLRDIRPGDLLVKTFLNDDKTDYSDSMHIGIVISNGNNDSSVFSMDNVLVLSTDETVGHVALGYWGDNGGLHRSFTKTPKDYVVRRLLTYKDKNDKGQHNAYNIGMAPDAWDAFNQSGGDLFAQIELSDKGNYERWIPNTGELIKINRISFLEEDENGTSLLEDSNVDVIIESPEDMYYTAGNNSEDNIFNNKGAGFAFYAASNDFKEAVKLVTFRLNPAAITGERYITEFNPDIFYTEGENKGMAKEGFSLKYNGVNLTFYSENNDRRFSKFGLRPLEDLYPGDDLLLQFKVMINASGVKVKAKDEDFMAVYDKKMLWRGNLYIDDKNKDWNNHHPWNAPPASAEANVSGEFFHNDKLVMRYLTAAGNVHTSDERYLGGGQWEIIPGEKIWYGPNEWNTPAQDYTGVPGGQVIEIEHYINIFGGGKITNRVAYSYPESAATHNCRNTPFEFNRRLTEQKEVMSLEYNIKGQKFLVPKNQWTPGQTINKFNLANYNNFIYAYPNSSAGNFPEEAVSLDSWNSVLPPQNQWSNYSIEDNGDHNSYLPGLGLIEFYGRSNNEQADMQFINTIYTGNGRGVGDFNDNRWAERAAGTDCIGFAQNSANHGFYVWDISLEGAGGVFRAYPRTSEDSALHGSSHYSEFIAGKSNTEQGENEEYTFTGDLNKVKPGDIFYHIWPPNADPATMGAPGGGRHIGIVQSVDKSGSSVTIDDIKIIEATFGLVNSTTAYVRSDIDLKQLIIKKHWRIVRLKVE